MIESFAPIFHKPFSLYYKIFWTGTVPLSIFEKCLVQRGSNDVWRLV